MLPWLGQSLGPGDLQQPGKARKRFPKLATLGSWGGLSLPRSMCRSRTDVRNMSQHVSMGVHLKWKQRWSFDWTRMTCDKNPKQIFRIAYILRLQSRPQIGKRVWQQLHSYVHALSLRVHTRELEWDLARWWNTSPMWHRVPLELRHVCAYVEGSRFTTE